MSKKLSDVWKSMPEEKKRKYVDLCHQEQEAGNVGCRYILELLFRSFQCVGSECECKYTSQCSS